MLRVRVKYEHPAKQGVILDAVGVVLEELNLDPDSEFLMVQRIDGYVIDVPKKNIIDIENLKTNS